MKVVRSQVVALSFTDYSFLAYFIKVQYEGKHSRFSIAFQSFSLHPFASRFRTFCIKSGPTLLLKALLEIESATLFTSSW